MKINLSYLQKFKIKLIFLIVMTMIGILFIIFPKNTTWTNIIGTIMTILFPIALGYYLNEYYNQKIALKEFFELIINLWDEACKIEFKSEDLEFFEDRQPINWGQYYNKICFKKEVCLLYVFGIYFDNLKWYNHELYHLPKDFKEKIKLISKTSSEIDSQMSKHSSFLFDEFLYTLHTPQGYNPENSTLILIDFFEFIVKNYSKDYKIQLKKILDILKEFYNNY